MRLQSNVFGVRASVACSQSRYGACAAQAEMPSPLNFRRERRQLLSSEHAQIDAQPARRFNGCLRPLKSGVGAFYSSRERADGKSKAAQPPQPHQRAQRAPAHEHSPYPRWHRVRIIGGGAYFSVN